MSKYRVVEHTSKCSHIREYPRATATHQNEVLQLAVKQYIPLDSPIPQEGDITFVATHANAMPKELYEPLWDDLQEACERAGLRIRSIWMADVAHQGASYLLNEDKIGNNPHFNDHARDLYNMINEHSDEMPRPVVGLGHSMGCTSLLWLANFHPRLFTTIIFTDSTFAHRPCPNIFQITKWATLRQDRWPTRSSAEAYFDKKMKMFQNFDPRVNRILKEHMFRTIPTHIYPSAGKPVRPGNLENPELFRGLNENAFDPPVTLRTPKHQEAATICRLNEDGHRAVGHPETTLDTLATHPDVHENFDAQAPLYFPSSKMSLSSELLPHLRPAAMYIWGSDSPYYAVPGTARYNHAVTGTGCGGSGGVKLGVVGEEVVPRAGHFVPFEQPTQTANAIASFLSAMQNKGVFDLHKDWWTTGESGDRERSMLEPRFIEAVKSWSEKDLEHNKEVSQRAASGKVEENGREDYSRVGVWQQPSSAVKLGAKELAMDAAGLERPLKWSKL